MNIDALFKIDTKIAYNKLIYSFTYNNHEMTKLRIMKMVEDVEEVLKTFNLDNVKNVCFVFVINEVTIPSNFDFLKDLSCLFHKYKDVIKEKLKFTIVHSKNSIFNILFTSFKTYYHPIKPMYICNCEDDVNTCLKSKTEREKFPNISNMVQST